MTETTRQGVTVETPEHRLHLIWAVVIVVAVLAVLTWLCLVTIRVTDEHRQVGVERARSCANSAHVDVCLNPSNR